MWVIDFFLILFKTSREIYSVPKESKYIYNFFSIKNEAKDLIISFISPFKINRVNLFPVLTAPFPLILLVNLFIEFEVKLLTNPGKLSLSNLRNNQIC